MSDPRVITKRAVLYVGYPCNAKCSFCYYKYAESKKWVPIGELKKDVSRFRYFYRMEFIDILGGEPTIYRHIQELVAHCSKIGLKPTLITNAIMLGDKKIVEEYKKNGINDFLISVYGIEKKAEKITGVRDMFQKQLKAIENLQALNIPFRFNVTLHKDTVHDLSKIAQFAVDKGAKALNMIVFNPFFEWEHKSNIDFQARYKEMTKPIMKAIDLLEKNGLDANVRYLPLCMLPGYEKNIYDYMQLPYDPHEWNYNTWENFFLWPGKKWYQKEAFRRREYVCRYKKSEMCNKCSVEHICDGFHKQYAERFGFGEETPYNLGVKVKDPTFFIKNQTRKLPKGTSPDKSVVRYFFNDPGLFWTILLSWKRYFWLVLSQNKIYKYFHPLP